jgi:Ca-activated chloride channel homolog
VVGVLAAAAASLIALPDPSPGACDTAVPLRIVASPAIAPAIQTITKRDIDVSCIAVRVVPQKASDAAESPTAGTLWVPDSSLWPELATQYATTQGRTPPDLRVGGALALSPLVAVTSRTGAARFGWPDAQPGWQDLIAGSVPTTIGDPLATTEGLSTLMVVRHLLGNPDGTPRPELVGALLRVGRNAVSAMQAAYDQFGTASDNGLAFTASEQSVLAYNRVAGRAPVVAMYPREGTVAMDHPLVRVGLPGPDPAADVVEAALRSPAAVATLRAAGFRAPDGSWGPDPDEAAMERAGVTRDLPPMVPLPPVEQANDVLRTWNAVNLDVRLLVLIDVSGSMDTATATGQTRVELARDAATTALQLYPESTHVGLWAFSIQQGPPDDWAELIPMGPVGTPGRRAALQAAFASLPGRTDGGTGLNDTVLAAVRTMRALYDTDRVNSVVLLTDGRDEDPDGIGEEELLRELRTSADPARPVPVMAIGMGPDVDFPALQRIAEATGGKAYLAAAPADIRGVFLDAIIQRRCRPTC